MFRKLGLAAAAAMAMWAMPAAAQTGPWKVVAAVPDIAIFAGDIAGPPNAREVHMFIMLPEAVGGVDNSINRWTIDCTAKTSNDHGGTSYLGVDKVGDLESVTPNGPEPFAEGLTSLVGDYVCSGKRLSDDNRIVVDLKSARALARAVFGQK
jgi:hypothetical protein